MVNIDNVADGARDAIDSMQDYARQAAKEFERIADLARSVDECNWRNVTDQIFDIAYNNY